MSNYLAIAAITVSIREIVQAAVQAVVPGVSVRIGPPRAVPASQMEVNIYLYRLSPNAFNRNEELPVGSGGGTVIPRVALDLHYLISFSGEEHLACEVMLGKVVAALHAKAALGAEDLAGVLGEGAAFPFLEQGYSAPQREQVKLTPEYLTLDELSKLWTVFFQEPHRPSLQYVASPVMLEAEIDPARAAPVARVVVEEE